jgi:hypothetical protein
VTVELRSLQWRCVIADTGFILRLDRRSAPRIHGDAIVKLRELSGETFVCEEYRESARKAVGAMSNVEQRSQHLRPPTSVG